MREEQEEILTEDKRECLRERKKSVRVRGSVALADSMTCVKLEEGS